jgi:hypothetical protein
VGLTTLKCEHVFCYDCLAKNKARVDCPTCFQEKGGLNVNRFADGLIKALDPFKDKNGTMLQELEVI